MNPVSRGTRNAFRNGVRTGSIVVILGLSIGLSLTMLIAQKAVDNKIKSVKSSIGNTLMVSPAGFNPGSQANNALSTSELSKVSSLSHVSSVTETLSDRESTTGTSSPSFGRLGSDNSSNTTTYTTSLMSPVTLSSNGPRFLENGSTDSTTSFSLPISFIGTNDPRSLNGSKISLQSGMTISGSSTGNSALISAAMASKNNLTVGSTFNAYNSTLTVAGIFSTTNRSDEDTVVLTLPTLQQLSGQSGIVTSAIVTVDSLDNLSSTTTAVKNTTGSSADVTSAQEQADNTVKPLNSVKTVSTFSLIGAVIAGAVIILLVMVMVVRERKKEIGVVKAIGGSNVRIIGEFMVESLTLAVLGAVIGLIIGVIGGQPVTKTLVNNSTASTATTQAPTGQGMGTRNFRAGGFGGGLRRNGAVQGIKNIKTQIGPEILLEGFGAAVLIALIGSALSAAMISKIRPATVMRTE